MQRACQATCAREVRGNKPRTCGSLDFGPVGMRVACVAVNVTFTGVHSAGGSLRARLVDHDDVVEAARVLGQRIRRAHDHGEDIRGIDARAHRFGDILGGDLLEAGEVPRVVVRRQLEELEIERELQPLLRRVSATASIMADYSSLKVPELKKLLTERGLPHIGNKADLIARLTENDTQKADAGAAPAGKLSRSIFSRPTARSQSPVVCLPCRDSFV